MRTLVELLAAVAAVGGDFFPDDELYNPPKREVPQEVQGQLQEDAKRKRILKAIKRGPHADYKDLKRLPTEKLEAYLAYRTEHGVVPLDVLNQLFVDAYNERRERERQDFHK